ncbi:polysaccharide biosynthesis/export family protein [Caballeronia sp. EK]|uniref:polysaccharide biosynthesis/export family protein n=1 Tax=Caballeronia sp. EK TaxID=2767469 RepID=UPI0016553BB6|nr:polysaccharide biosynthesis/export family protein [Caballeronia sp. EK]MBC8642017.1 polysaccharide biosynthesis/export family protein [Caballeronia sp. EK]
MKSTDLLRCRKLRCASPYRSAAALVFALSSTLALQGCGLPRSGPLHSEVDAAGESSNIVLVPVTEELARTSRGPDRASFPAAFLGAAPFDYDRLAPGDGVQVTLWEHDGLGLFAAGKSGASNLGELIVDRAGDIHLPYIGKVRAQGQTPAQLHDAILRRVSRLVVGADVSVQATARRGQTVTVQGDLSKPGIYSLGRDTERLSGLLGLAAPNQSNPEQLSVTVRRNGVAGSVRLADIYRDPAEDVALRPGDSIVVSGVVERLTVLGAAGVQGRVKLMKRNYSVLDALGDSRGLSDSLANPRAVYLLRRQSAPGTDAAQRLDTRPLVYQFDFTKPGQIMLAGEFVVRDGDAILISDAPFTQVQKLLSTFSATLGTARSISTLTD